MNSLITINISRYHKFSLCLTCLVIFSLAAGCIQPTGDISIEQTQIAIKGTELAIQSVATAQALEATSLHQQILQLTLDAEQASPPAGEEMQSEPTAPPPTEVQPPTELPPPPTEIPPTVEAQEPSSRDLESFMSSADILLYEDMAGVPRTYRYVQQALDEMGLAYVDTKDWPGRFREYLISGPSQGEWDLVISATESRDAVRGEFWDYLEDALDQGSSVIVETWLLDQQVGGRAGDFLKRCGIEFQTDWFAPPPSQMVLTPHSLSHPVLHEPNEVISMRVHNFWKGGDMGDLLELPFGSDAVLIWGARPQVPDSYGVLTVCQGGQMILQTFPTHQYEQDSVVMLWQNYIYQALKARYNLEQ